MVNISCIKGNFVLTLFFLLFLTSKAVSQIQTDTIPPEENILDVRHCATMTQHQYLMKNNPAYRAARHQIDRYAQTFVEAARLQGSGAIITIPVAFHVIYRTTAQNISDAQINAQIKQLNDDYRHINSDRSATPSAFQGAVGDMEIQFCLATRDPNGNATTGITRTSTTKASFTDATFETEKPTTIWDRDKYLNLWSANLSGGLLGYAQFPGGPATTDGVVLLYSSVGSIDQPGTATNFKLGRTASHEIGHWLNLYHIWGDDDPSCEGSDQVCDTPNQTSASSGCPSYPKTDACTASAPGVMFMNYMDYSYDNCLNMFTYGQKRRMIATLNDSRASLLSSNGCTPLTADYSLNTNIGTKTTCSNSTISYTISSMAINSYATNITLSTTDVPTNCTATIASSTLTPGGSTTLTLSIGALSNGFYHFWVKSASGASNTDSIALTFVVASAPNAPTLTYPANTSTGQSITPRFAWNTVSEATSYDFQLSSTSNFSNIIQTSNNLNCNYAIVPTTSPLSNTTTYYWRVLARNACSASSYATGSFTTGTITCLNINSTNIPKTISATGTPLVSSTLNFPHSGTVTDINVTNITGTHSYIYDLIFRLRSPTNTDVTLLYNPCDAEQDFNIGFDDQATNEPYTYNCPPTNGQLYQTESPLTAFNGFNANGSWTLLIRDTSSGDGGTLNAWGLRICVNNIVIPVEMVDFKAKPLSNTIQLVWQTATERNNVGFEIQRSTDPLFTESRSNSSSNFTTIGFVKGQGNATKLTDYQFIDENVRLGTTYYYRLRQIDFDGKEMLSKVEAANLDKDGVWDIALEPNPAESTLNVEVLGKINQTVTLDLYSIDGKLILTKNMAQQNAKIALDLTPLSSGIYMLKCHAGQSFFVKKVVKK